MHADLLKEKSWLISLLVALFALLIAASVHDLLVALAVCAAVFIFGYPVLSTYRAWNRKEDPELWIQTIVSALPFPLGIWVFATGLADKGFGATAEAFEWVGGDLVAFFAFILFAGYIPRWKRQRKVCPECCEVIKHEARVCPHCRFRWESPLSAKKAT